MKKQNKHVPEEGRCET